jgi:hypothetical protein
LEIATDSQAIFSWQALTYLAGENAVLAFNEAADPFQLKPALYGWLCSAQLFLKRAHQW